MWPRWWLRSPAYSTASDLPPTPESPADVRYCEYKLDSADDQQKKLVLDALNAEVSVTGQKVKLHLGLGVEHQDSRLITTAQTSGCFSVGDYNYKAIYVLNPVAVKMLAY